MSNLIVLSLPRSGSTWFAKRLSQINGSNLIMEPSRRFFNTSRSDRLSCHRVYEANDFDDPGFWGRLSGFEKNRVFLFVDWANKQDGLIIKDVASLFQIPFLMRAFPSFVFLYLRRHLGAALDSHIRIPGVFDEWFYDARIDAVREQLSEESRSMYERAKDCELRGDRKWAILLAHLAVQQLECQRNIKNILNYEKLVDEGEYPVFLERLGFRWDREEIGIRGDKKPYTVHGTKNPVSLFAWVKKYSKEDILIIKEILGQHFAALFPSCGAVSEDGNDPFIDRREVLLKKEAATLPALEFIEIPGGSKRVSNRIVTLEEYLLFVNWLIKQGIEDVRGKLSVRFAQNKVFKREKCYLATQPHLPMNNVSPIGAMAYCRFVGGELPDARTYDLLNRQYGIGGINDKLANFAEDIGHMTVVGQYPALQGFYDLFGNCRELCLGNGGRAYAVGGSYRDERMHLGLDRRNEISMVIGDHDIGFRIEKGISKNNIDRRRLVELIRNAGSPADIFRALK